MSNDKTHGRTDTHKLSPSNQDRITTLKTKPIQRLLKFKICWQSFLAEPLKQLTNALHTLTNACNQINFPKKKRQEKRRLNAFKRKRFFNAVKRVTNFKRSKTPKKTLNF